MDTSARVRAVLEQSLPESRHLIAPSARIIGELGATSMDLVEVAMALEEEFESEYSRIRIPIPISIGPATTVGDLERAISGWMSE